LALVSAITKFVQVCMQHLSLGLKERFSKKDEANLI